MQPVGRSVDDDAGHKMRSNRSEHEFLGVHFGTVDWFNDAKGYGYIRIDNNRDLGFIKPGGSDQDAWVHFSAICSTAARRTLMERQRVEFELMRNEKGLYAASVKVVTQ
jgi:CspA family cold shock protein